MTTMREFVKDAGITATSEQVSKNPNMVEDDWSRGARHYKVTLRRAGKRFTTYFSKGSALPYGVEPHEIVNSLASDWSTIQSASGWKDWAKDMGYDWEPHVEEIRSRRQAEDYGYEKDWDTMKRAEKTYHLIETQTEKLRAFLGPDLYHPLLSGEIEFD